MLHPNEPLLVSANVEVLLMDYLEAELAKYAYPYTEGIEVGLSANENFPEMPENFVSVKMGEGAPGTSRFSSDTPIIITSFSTSRSYAWNLAQLVEGLMHRAPLHIADITFTAALGSPIVGEDVNSDRFHSRFQSFTVRSKKNAL